VALEDAGCPPPPGQQLRHRHVRAEVDVHERDERLSGGLGIYPGVVPGDDAGGLEFANPLECSGGAESHRITQVLV
jgi:hypothetical protein